MTKTVNIGKEFSRYPAGRYPSDGKFNGQTFRRRFLIESLKANEEVKLHLDDAIDYGSSFLEEAFGGLIREEGFSKDFILGKLILISADIFLIDEIITYINEAEAEA